MFTIIFNRDCIADDFPSAADGGNQMLVCRWRDAKDGFPPSLYLSLTAGEKLNRKYSPVLPDPQDSEKVVDPTVKIDSVRELIKRYRKLPSTEQGLCNFLHLLIMNGLPTIIQDVMLLLAQSLAVSLFPKIWRTLNMIVYYC